MKTRHASLQLEWGMEETFKQRKGNGEQSTYVIGPMKPRHNVTSSSNLEDDYFYSTGFNSQQDSAYAMHSIPPSNLMADAEQLADFFKA
eukprot:6311921-Amphidinium_carterae.2